MFSSVISPAPEIRFISSSFLLIARAVSAELLCALRFVEGSNCERVF